MKFKASDFSGYPTDCKTVKAMLKWAKGKKEFTMEEFDSAFPSSRVFEESIRYMKPALLKPYMQEYMSERGDKMIHALVSRHNQLADINAEKARILSSAERESKHKKEELDRLIEQYRVNMLNLGRDKVSDRKVPSVRRIMGDFYEHARRDVTALNSLLHSVMCNCIMAQVDFDEDDFAWVDKNCNGGYWFGVSTNGKSMGESFYNLACVYNSSATLSYEKFMHRVPFLLKNHKLHTGVKFKMDGLIWTVTGWTNYKDSTKYCNSENPQDAITCVGYKNMEGKGERKLKKFNREEWLEARKKAELITDYSFHSAGRHY